MFENTPSSEKKIFLFEILSPNDMITEFLRVCVTFLQEVYFDLTHWNLFSRWTMIIPVWIPLTIVIKMKSDNLMTQTGRKIRESGWFLQNNAFYLSILVTASRYISLQFGRLFLHKHSFCLLSHHDLLFLEKRCHTYLPPEYFLGLIYRLGTRVSSIFQTHSQTPIINPVEHLRRSFFFENS